MVDIGENRPPQMWWVKNEIVWKYMDDKWKVTKTEKKSYIKIKQSNWCQSECLLGSFFAFERIAAQNLRVLKSIFFSVNSLNNFFNRIWFTIYLWAPKWLAYQCAVDTKKRISVGKHRKISTSNAIQLLFMKIWSAFD